MEQLAPAARLIRFGVFELDLRTGELRKSGLKLRLHGQPVEILKLLLERPGELVTREELEKRLWVGDTVVEFEHSINAAVNRLREALGDTADNPRFIETLARRGYRFIAPVEAHHPQTPSSERRGGETGSPPDSEKRGTSPDSPPGSGGGQGVLEMPSTPHKGGAGFALPSGAQSAGWRTPLQKRWRLALAAMGIVGVLAALVALNVAGLRDRVLAVVGAGPRARPTEGTHRGVPLPKIESIAVLPLENLSGDPDQEYFADGMTEELITTLGKIGSLRVISRTSVMRFKGARPAGGLAEIAQKLNVDAVVEGSVMRSGDRVRITANLLDARSERHLWAEAYDRDLRDVLALQSEVARAIADKIKAKLTPAVQARLASARPVKPEALEPYLKGNDWLRRDDPKKALEYFQQSVAKDPNFARAYLGVAWSYSRFALKIDIATVEAYAKQKAYARKALELDDSLAEAHLALAGALMTGDWDWSGAEREIKRALEINPNSGDALRLYTVYLSLLGRPDEAVVEAKRWLEIAPQLAAPYLVLCQAYYNARRYDEALAQCRKAVEVGGPNRDTRMFLGLSYQEKGMYKEAIAELLQMPDGVTKLAHLGRAYARAGNKAEAQIAIQKLIVLSKQKRGSYEMALVYAGLGEKDRAFEWLDRAYKIHDRGMVWSKVNPTLDPLRSDPRFQDLLRRMNFPP